MTRDNIKGWAVLNKNNAVIVTKLIGKIKMTVERGAYLGRQNIRISSKVLDEAFELLDKKAQRIRKKEQKK